jgi:hypothetical protein
MSTIDVAVKQITDSIKLQMESRSYRAANEMRNAALLVLRGQRSGRRYLVPGTKRYYQASAPGEPPAVRTGIFRLSWQPSAHVVFGSYISRIESNVKIPNGRTLGDILENGTSRMAPRPHHDRILDKAEPDIVRIYSQSYF